MQKKLIIRLVIPALAIVTSAFILSPGSSASDRSTCKETMEDTRKPANDGKLLWETIPGHLFSRINVLN